MNAGDVYFRFYTELGEWGNDNELPSIGAQGKDANVDLSFPAGGYSGAAFQGKGNWNFTDWPGGKMKMVVDLTNMRVEFTKVEE